MQFVLKYEKSAGKVRKPLLRSLSPSVVVVVFRPLSHQSRNGSRVMEEFSSFTKIMNEKKPPVVATKVADVASHECMRGF